MVRLRLHSPDDGAERDRLRLGFAQSASIAEVGTEEEDARITLGARRAAALVGAKHGRLVFEAIDLRQWHGSASRVEVTAAVREAREAADRAVLVIREAVRSEKERR